MLTGDEALVSLGGPIARAPRAAAEARANQREVAGPADLGINYLSLTLIGVQLVTATLLGLLYRGSLLTIEWPTATFTVTCLGGVCAIWLYLFVQPGRNRRTWAVAESLVVLLLIMSLGLIASTGQYLVALFHRPLIDPYLAMADHWLGVSVPRLVVWTRHHDWVAVALHHAYFTLAPQFLLAIVGLGVVLRDRDRLWEFTFHYHFCLLITVAASAVFPVECAFTFYGFESIIDQGRFIRQFEGLRAATFEVIRFDDLEGIISFPSFHAAGGLMVTWAFRAHRAWLWPLIVLSIGL